MRAFVRARYAIQRAGGWFTGFLSLTTTCRSGLLDMNTFFRYTLGVVAVMGLALSVAVSAAPTSKSSDLLTSKQVKALIASAHTPADHVKLQNHFLALAAKHDADAAEHASEGEAYRKNPSFRDTKSPVGPGTAAHCDRFAELDREAAKEARELAAAHEHMAAAK
jgi:hypothetical protein